MNDEPNNLYDETKTVLEFYIRGVLENLSLGMLLFNSNVA